MKEEHPGQQGKDKADRDASAEAMQGNERAERRNAAMMQAAYGLPMLSAFLPFHIKKCLPHRHGHDGDDGSEGGA